MPSFLVPPHLTFRSNLYILKYNWECKYCQRCMHLIENFFQIWIYIQSFHENLKNTRVLDSNLQLSLLLAKFRLRNWLAMCFIFGKNSGWRALKVLHIKNRVPSTITLLWIWRNPLSCKHRTGSTNGVQLFHDSF